MKVACLAALVVTASGLAGCGKRPAAPVAQHPEVVEAQKHFTFRGAPIPPFFLADFYGGPNVGDFWTKGMGTRISTIAVEGLFYEHSDGSYSGCRIESGNDFLRFDLPTSGDIAKGEAGWFSYKFLGTTPSGVTVLEYVGNTGGSGTVPGVLFVKFEMEPVGYTADGKRERLVMRFLGEESWGDRVFRDVELAGNELRLGPERSNMPGAQDDLEPARTILLE